MNLMIGLHNGHVKYSLYLYIMFNLAFGTAFHPPAAARYPYGRVNMSLLVRTGRINQLSSLHIPHDLPEIQDMLVRPRSKSQVALRVRAQWWHRVQGHPL
jgi:hypothetical protein